MSENSKPYSEMKVHDDFVPEDLFSDFISQMPQVCVDLILETDDGILIAKRENDPQVWFFPGSRLYKGEQLEAAAHRIAHEELGIEVNILDQYGPYAHFWENSSVKESPSRHTVNVVYHVTPSNNEYEIELDNQHSAYRFVTELESDLHEYVQLYVQDNNLL